MLFACIHVPGQRAIERRSTRDVVDVGRVVMTLSGVPPPSWIKRCLLPVFRRSTGDGSVSVPFWCGYGSLHVRP